jgi:hypothetical protein
VFYELPRRGIAAVRRQHREVAACPEVSSYVTAFAGEYSLLVYAEREREREREYSLLGYANAKL